MPPAAGAVSPRRGAQLHSAGADVDRLQAAGAASSFSRPANAASPAAAHPSTLLDDTQSVGAGPTLSQTASAANAYGPNEAAHMRMCACPGIDILAYADDIILVLHPEIATP
eukprot:4532093-Amphidinium_carterae.1